MAFDKWDWDHKVIHGTLRDITRTLQRAVWESKIRTVERREDGYERWDIIRNLRYPADYAVWKFFPEGHA